MNDQRKLELLQIARRSRIKWVLDARDHEGTNCTDAEHESAAASSGSSHVSSVSEQLKARVPVSECLQTALNYLSEVIDDGERYDVQTIIYSCVDWDEYEDDSDDNAHDAVEPAASYSYNAFVHQLSLPVATDIVKSMQQFIVKFGSEYEQSRADRARVLESGVRNGYPMMGLPEDATDYNWSNRIFEFLEHLWVRMGSCPLWDGATLDATKGYAEKFVFKKLHVFLFSTDYNDDSINERTMERIESLSFLTPEHLDIKCIRQLHRRRQERVRVGTSSSIHDPSYSKDFLDDVLKQPMGALLEMSKCFCPQDKLLCIKRCAVSIAQLLKESRADSSSLPGADELLPMMIFTIKCCNPCNLHSDLKYLQRYTRPAQLISEAGYLLTNFVSAVFFLDNVDAKALTIDPDEFDRAIAESKRRAKSGNEQLRVARTADIRHSSSESSSDNPSASAMVHLLDVEHLMTDYKRSVHALRKKEAAPVAVDLRKLSQRKEGR